MNTIRKFMEFTALSKQWKQLSLLIAAASILYCAVYTMLMEIVYRLASGALYYLTLYLIVIAAGIGYMSLLFHFLQQKREAVRKYRIKEYIAPMLLVQSIFYVLLVGGSTLVVQMYLEGEKQLGAIASAVVMLLAIFYAPMQVFSVFVIHDGTRNPFAVIKKSFLVLLRHYQSVFYSLFAITLLIALYYSMMDAFFQIPYVFSASRIAIDVMTFNPFLLVFEWFSNMFSNPALMVAVGISVVFAVIMSVVFCFYFMLMACIFDGDISV